MQVKSTAECSTGEHSAVLLTCIKVHGLKPLFCLLSRWLLKTHFTVFHLKYIKDLESKSILGVTSMYSSTCMTPVKYTGDAI